MANLGQVKGAARTAKPDAPFGTPSDDEVFELLIPEGAETGQIPESDQYIGKLIALTREIAKSSGNKMWVAVFTIEQGDYRGMDFKLFMPMQANALWKAADTLRAIGVEFEAGVPFTFRAKDVLGTLVRLVIKDDKDQNGRDVSRLASVLPHPDGAGTKRRKKGLTLPVSAADPEDDEDEDDDEAPAPVRKGKRRPEPEPEPDEDDDEDAEDDDEEKWPLPPASPARKKKAPEPEPDDDDEDEDEDEDEPPVRKIKKAVPPARKGKAKSRL